MIERKKTIGTIGYMGGIMSLPEPFAWSWSEMREFTREAVCQEDEQIKFTRTKYSLHSAARNDLVSKLKGDWLMQFDTDMEFEPDFAARLITIFERYKLDILTGLYVYKTQPGIPTLYMYNSETGRHEHIGKIPEESEIFEVDSAGGGCLLVRKAVYERIVTELYQPPFEMTAPYGEDHSFFLRARKLGYKCYCAWKVQASHLDYSRVRYQPDSTLDLLTDYAVTGFGTKKGELQHAS
jgi:GT2 family glycosyltransferase